MIMRRLSNKIKKSTKKAKATKSSTNKPKKKSTRRVSLKKPVKTQKKVKAVKNKKVAKKTKKKIKTNEVPEIQRVLRRKIILCHTCSHEHKCEDAIKKRYPLVCMIYLKKETK